MEDLIKKSDVLEMLHSLGGCGAEADTYSNGWDNAINAAYTAVSRMEPERDMENQLSMYKEDCKTHEQARLHLEKEVITQNAYIQKLESALAKLYLENTESCNE